MQGLLNLTQLVRLLNLTQLVPLLNLTQLVHQSFFSLRGRRRTETKSAALESEEDTGQHEKPAHHELTLVAYLYIYMVILAMAFQLRTLLPNVVQRRSSFVAKARQIRLQGLKNETQQSTVTAGR